MNTDVVITKKARPRAIVAVQIEDGLALVTLDDHAEVHNTITPALGGELGAVIDELERDSRVRAIVLRSGKKDSFLVGANIDFLRSLRFASDAEEASREVSKRWSRLEKGPKPVVALVHGPALGGGFELALACTATVVTDDPSTVLGLPEVKLGVIPAANGILRIARRAGLRVAIDLGVTGRNLKPARAKALGLVDEVVPPEIALDAAKKLALSLVGRGAPARKKNLATRLDPFLAPFIIARARTELLAKTRGHYPAGERVLDVLASRSPAVEARAFGELVVSETAHRLIEVFFAQNAAKKTTGLGPNENATPLPIERIAVMDERWDVAAAASKAGIHVRLHARDDAALGRGLLRIRELRGDFARITATTDESGKRDLTVKGDHVLVGGSARVGMKTWGDLAEVIRGPEDDPRAVRTAVAFARMLNKTVIVTRGPFVWRLVDALAAEKKRLVDEGISKDDIERALVDWGFPGTAPGAHAKRPDEITLRCSLAVVNEALAAFGEGIVDRPRDADLGAVFGAGFPAFRGGPLRYVDVLGADAVLRRMRSLEARFPRFAPAPLLVEMARQGRRFYD